MGAHADHAAHGEDTLEFAGESPGEARSYNMFWFISYLKVAEGVNLVEGQGHCCV